MTNASAAVTRRFAVVERLRRALFAPSKSLAVCALALALSAGTAFGDDAVVGTLKAQNYVVDGTLDLTLASYDAALKYAPYSIALNGGALKITTGTTAPMLDSGTLRLTDLMNPQAYDGTNQLESVRLIFNNARNEILKKNSEQIKDVYNAYQSASLETIYENNTISQAVNFQGHYLDLSAGGTVEVANMPLDFSKTPTENLRNSLWNAFGIGASAQTINGKFTKTGDGTLTISSYQNSENQTAATEFQGKLNVNGGQLSVYGAAVYDKEVAISASTLYAFANNGEQTFKAKVEVKDGGSLQVHGLPETPITFEDDVTVNGGSLYSWGDVAYKGDVTIRDTDELTVFSGTMGYLSAGQTTWSETSKLTIANAANVFGNANCLNVDLTLSDGGVLTYANIDKQFADTPYFNQFYITLDENQTPTVLKWTSGSENIKKALENGNLITQNITSSSANAQLYLTTLGLQPANQLGEANGYTVVFNNADGKAFDYAGMTMVDNAFMVVQGDANFGSYNAAYDKETGENRSHFRVFGEAYSQINANTWKVQGSGMLGFDRDDASATSAPSITADLVEFTSGVVAVSNADFNYTKSAYQGYGYNAEEATAMTQAYFKNTAAIGGSRIWVNTTFNGQYDSQDNKTFKLGAINANELVFADNTQIWYDGISTQPSDVKMTFDLNAPKIQYQTTSDNLTITEGGYGAYLIQREVLKTDDATVGDIEDLFGAAVLVDAKYVPTAADADASDLTEAQRRSQVATAGSVTISAKDVGDYAAEQGMTGKEQELARKLDGARVEGGSSTSFYDALYNETEDGKVRQTIHNLSLLGYNMLNAQGHFGNPTSAFFGGSSVSGEAKRGQNHERLDPDEWDSNPKPNQASGIEKQREDYNPTRGLWAAYTYSSVDGDDYVFENVKTHGYELRRHGVIGGVRRQIDATTSAGLFFGVSLPEVTSSAALDAGGQIAGNGYGTVGSTMEMTDFQYAVHFEKVFADVWELAAYVGGGTQDMKWRRDADFTQGGRYRYEADGAGNTLTGTLYLSYRVDVDNSLTLRPTIGVDSEHSWLYGFQEQAVLEGEGGGNVALNPYTDMFAQAYNYRKTYYNRNTARAGLSFAYVDPRHGLTGLNGRVFYGVKLGGDDAPELSYYNQNYKWENMASHEMGDSSLNVGGGGFMHLNPIKTLTATGDVNAIWYKNAQTFNVTGGLSYRF